jgi:hypothetical protein
LIPFPKLYQFASGISETVDIVYRPLEKVPQNEVLTFKSSSGIFSIPLCATVPTLSIAIPSELDFQLCPVKETTVMSFEVLNTGEVDAEFNFEIPDENPRLVLEPVKGIVECKKSILVNAYYTPDDATILLSNVVCISGDTRQIIIFHATGKYPYLQASTNSISFGEVFFSLFFL